MENELPSIRILKAELTKVEDSSLLIGIFKGNFALSAELKRLDDSMGGLISSYIADNGFKGEKSELRSIYAKKNVKNIVLAGLGDEKNFNPEVFSSIIADASKRIRDGGSLSFSIALNSFSVNGFDEGLMVEKAALSALMGL